jgi:BlaI family penicillinase repressor
MSDSLSRRERQIRDVLFEPGEAPADEVRQALNADLANATVHTILRNLEAKGVVTHREDGKRFLYKVIQSRKTDGKLALQRVLNLFYDGSVEDALASHLLEYLRDSSRWRRKTDSGCYHRLQARLRDNR